MVTAENTKIIILSWHDNYFKLAHTREYSLYTINIYIQFICIAAYAVEYRPTYMFMQCITYKSM